MSQRGLSSHADESVGSDVCNSIAAPGKGRGSGCSDLWPHGQSLRPLMPRCSATEFWRFLLFSLPFSLDLLPRSGRKRVRALQKTQKIFFLLNFLALQLGWAPLFSSLLCYHSVLKLVLRNKWLYIVLFQIVLAALSLNSSTSLDFTPNYNFLLQKLYKNHNWFFTLKKAVSSSTKHCCATAFASTSFGV